MRIKHLSRHEGGTAVIELALVLPLMSMLMASILSYGVFFWRAHALQEAASSATRAALAGVTIGERSRYLNDALDQELPQLSGLRSAEVSRSIVDTGTTLTLDLSYDGSRDMLMGAGLVPLPQSVIRRRAVIRLAGL